MKALLFIHHLQNTKKGYHLAKLSTALFILLALWSLSLLAQNLWQNAKHEKETPLSSPSEAANQHPLAKAHLFGSEALRLTDAIPLKDSVFKITGLIIQSEAKAFSKALIASEGLPAKVYQVGDLLADGRRLVAIQPEGVYLEHQTRLELLPFERPHLFTRDS